MEKLWRRSHKSYNGEQCQRCAPQRESISQIELRLVRHIMFPSENHNQINGSVVEAFPPLIPHPQVSVPDEVGRFEAESDPMLRASGVHEVFRPVHLEMLSNV